MTSETYLIKTAPQFDVHKWSDYAEVNLVVDAIFNEIKVLRNSNGIRVRNAPKLKKHLKVVVIDLWAAAKLALNPYRAISKNKSDYSHGSRYKQIFLSHTYFVGVINDLRDLGYIVEKIGGRFASGGFRTRVKATPKLIDKILFPDYGLNQLVSSHGNIAFISRTNEIESESIILRDSDSVNIDYDDTPTVIQMRDCLKKINTKIAETRITLDITDDQYHALIEQLSSERNPRATIDFTKNQMYRVFNNSSFEDGGRFYGGWWELIPKEYRKYIEIDRKPIVELDYSGHHIRMLYAKEDILPPDEPYDLAEFDREDQKLAVLIMINASNENTAISAMRKKGIRNAKEIVEALKIRHSAIKNYFFTGTGNHLMYKDSVLAEKVMLLMLARGATVLPVHDSFIVRNSYSDELEEMMDKAFQEMFDTPAKLKPKKTVLQEIEEGLVLNEDTIDFVSDDLEELLQGRVDNNKWYMSVWGL